MSLTEYHRKRHFGQTPEPSAKGRPAAGAERAIFAVQLHHARRRHYDFRLQVGSTLKSWAVPKGPSLDPAVKRLAVEVEDHPIDYATFEGTIPAGQYGAGDVVLFDHGIWSSKGDVPAQLAKGHLRFELFGERLKGAWHLIRGKRGKQPEWLLIKHNDRHASDCEADDLLPALASPARAKQEKATAQHQAQAATGRSNKTKRPRLRSWDRKTKGLVQRKAARLNDQAFAPELARLRDAPPVGDNWLHETKWDGYRMLATVVAGTVRLWSRNGVKWTAKLPEIVDALEQLRLDNAAFDGEVIAGNGSPADFGALQATLSGAQQAPLHYVIFDLLHLSSYNLRDVPLIERKAMLEQILLDPPPRLAYGSHILGHGEQAFAMAVEHGLEGSVSKRAQSPYRSGRTDDWRKCKRRQSDEFAVIGFTAATGNRSGFGSLLLACPDPEGGWRYAGRVGSGFSDAQLRALAKTLKEYVQKTPAAQLPGQDSTLKRATWVAPRMVVEVLHQGTGNQGLLRQTSFKTVRKDKRPADLSTTPDAAPSASSHSREDNSMNSTRITHPDRVIYAGTSIRKRDVANYYLAVMDWFLPGIRDRPLSIMRCPDGADHACFFQKHHGAGLDQVATVQLKEESGNQASYLVVSHADAVMQLVQMNALEFHPWGAMAANPDRADRLVFDLDPGPDVAWSEIKRAAWTVRQRLEQLALQCFLRTTGGKGLHVVVPLQPACAWDEVKAFTRAFAQTLARTDPQHFVAVASKQRRRGKIFIDYLRNSRGATGVASYSLRARAGAPVAVPLAWRELGRLKGSDAYDLTSVARRLAHLRDDPWQDMATVKQGLQHIDALLE